MTFKQQYIAFNTLVRKEIIRFIRIWPQTILPSVITMTLYLVIFGTFIGSRIENMGDFTYIQFIIPGLIMMSVITNSYSNVVSSFFGSKFQKSVEELLVSPTSNYVIVLGYTIGGVLRGLFVAVGVTIVSLLFTEIKIFNLWILSVFIILTAVLFSLGGFLNAIYAKKFDDVTIIPTFVLTPLIYLGGVFYSIDLLGPFWQALSKINPILYMVNGFRYGFLGFSDVGVTFGLTMIVISTVIFFYSCIYMLKKGIGLKN